MKINKEAKEMEICIMTVKNPPKFGKKEISTERKLPFWIPVSDAYTKGKLITLTRRFKVVATAKNQREAKTKISNLLSQLSQIGLEIVRSEEE